MTDFKQAILGTVVALLSAIIVFGSLALSFVEDGRAQAGLPASSMGQVNSTLPTLEVQQGSRIPTVVVQEIPGSVAITVPGNSENPFQSTCQPPAGWRLYTILPDDSPDSLALRFGLSPEEFARANCLEVAVSSLPPGATVFVPVVAVEMQPTPLPSIEVSQVSRGQEVARRQETVKRKEAACGPPSRWVAYVVRSGDTLYSLSAITGASIAEIQRANCLGSSTLIRAGRSLFLPFYPVTVVEAPQTRRASPTPVRPTVYPTLPPGYSTPRPSPTPYPTEQPPTGTTVTATSLPPTAPPPTQPPTEPPMPTQPPAPTNLPPTAPPQPTQPPPTQPPAPTSPPPTQPPAPTNPPPTQPPAPTQPPPTQPPIEPPPSSDPPPSPSEPPAPAEPAPSESSTSMLERISWSIGQGGWRPASLLMFINRAFPWYHPGLSYPGWLNFSS